MSISIICVGIEILGKFEHSSPVCLQLDFFLKVGFNRITCREPQGRMIGIDQVIIRAGDLINRYKPERYQGTVHWL